MARFFRNLFRRLWCREYYWDKFSWRDGFICLVFLIKVHPSVNSHRRSPKNKSAREFFLRKISLQSNLVLKQRDRGRDSRRNRRRKEKEVNQQQQLKGVSRDVLPSSLKLHWNSIETLLELYCVIQVFAVTHFREHITHMYRMTSVLLLLFYVGSVCTDSDLMAWQDSSLKWEDVFSLPLPSFSFFSLLLYVTCVSDNCQCN